MTSTPLIRSIRHLSKAGAAALLLALAGSAGKAQTVYAVGRSSSYPLPANFYGANGQARNSFDWQYPNGIGGTNINSYYESFAGNATGSKTNVLGSMNYGLLRLPAGTGSNYFEWQFGTMYTGYVFGSNVYSTNVVEMAAEIGESGAQPVLVLNMLTEPSIPVTDIPQLGALDSPGGPSASGGGPDNQLGSNGYIAEAAVAFKNLSPNVTLTNIELGNEFYFSGPNTYGATNGWDNIVYPEGSAYGTTATSWIGVIHALGSYKCAAVAAANYDTTTDPRQTGWNPSMFTTLIDGTEDALTLHMYVEPNITSSSFLTVADANNMFGAVFWEFDQTTNYYVKDVQNGASGTPIWVTEYNYDDSVRENSSGAAIDGTPLYHGTWAHGLGLATMSLKYLELLPDNLQMLLHHCVVYDNGAYPDIFQDDNSLHEVNSAFIDDGVTSAFLSTEQFGLSAGGVVTQLIDTAAKGQTKATEVNFTSGGQQPTDLTTSQNLLDDTGDISYPPLYGWEFSGLPQSQLVIVNLADKPSSYTINLSGLSTHMASGTYTQVNDSYPGDYIVDGARLTGSMGPGSMQYNGQAGRAVKTTGSLNATTAVAFTLPKFSITVISYAP